MWESTFIQWYWFIQCVDSIGSILILFTIFDGSLDRKINWGFWHLNINYVLSLDLEKLINCQNVITSLRFNWKLNFELFYVKNESGKKLPIWQKVPLCGHFQYSDFRITDNEIIKREKCPKSVPPGIISSSWLIISC